ncbi:hypothetical protein WMF28_09995 [Sorangium sp. So ce590]|uniref:hypothetical protein n=1 Tax=Sorangium sp. So ce590 TaxID=3133317 RepID=UPI003F623152
MPPSGHALPKLAELLKAPAVGAAVLADRERRVVDVGFDAARSEAAVYLREDADDLSIQVDAAA